MSDARLEFEREGRPYSCSRKARFLLELANGTSSYQLVLGLGAEPDRALLRYDDLTLTAGQRKRLTMFDEGKRVVIARSK